MKLTSLSRREVSNATGFSETWISRWLSSAKDGGNYIGKYDIEKIITVIEENIIFLTLLERRWANKTLNAHIKLMKILAMKKREGEVA